MIPLLAAAALAAPLWDDATATTIGATAGWTSKVEVVDVDGDGRLDVVLANGQGYSTPEKRELTQIFVNQGAGVPFLDRSDLLGAVGYARVTKTRDLDGDGVPDVLIGNAYGDEARLFLGDGAGGFVDHSADLPQIAGISLGDLEVGDVDGDGDLDIAAADWGAGDALNGNGFARLWLNDGSTVFTEAPAGQVPSTKIGMSWDMELEDVDDDWDLDLLYSSKVSGTSFLFRNDGTGTFTDDTANAMPHFTNNYELEPMDVDGDGFVDLATINDGPGLDEHLLLGDGAGGFVDGTAAWWPAAANIGQDDNVVAFLDFDADGDADFLIGSLGSHDRLLVNDGGALRLADTVTGGPTTSGTLGIAVGDLDDDGRPDLAMSQGEVTDADKVYLANASVAVDTAGPTIGPVEAFAAPVPGPVTVHARVTDRKTPVLTDDFTSVTLSWSVGGGAVTDVPMTWYGGSLWRASIAAEGTVDFTICATDRAGNPSCGAPATVEITPDAVDTGATEGDADADADSDSDADSDADADVEPDTDAASDTDGDGDDSKGGCGCDSGTSGGSWLLAALAILALRRR